MDPVFGEGYEEDRNQPAQLRVVAAIGVAAELVNITNSTDTQVIRESVRFERDNENGSVTSLSFDLALPNQAYSDIPTRRYLMVDDPDRANGLGGYAGIFSGEIASTDVKPDGDERVVAMRGMDWGDLMRRPPKQITTQWPPGDGTPVVDTTVAAPLTAGAGVVVTPRSMRHIYVGKRLFASNSDGSNKERITVTDVDYVAGTFVADFDTDKASTETTVPLSMHATGLQTITPDSMANIGVGALVYCYKTHGVQTQGNEWTVVESVTATTFDAYFNAWKTHDWVVRSEWRIFGGVSDMELIAEGFYMDLDTLDEETGDITTEMVWIPSLLDEFFNNEGLQVFKDGVFEIIESLPHGKWEATDPAEVLNWVVEQNADTAKKPTWYMSFKQGTSTSMSVLPPLLRYYDAYDASLLAPVKLTNTQVSYDPAEMARFIDYARREDGTQFANVQTVMGSNFSVGRWVDQLSIDDPDASNYVGRAIEAPVVVDNNLHTNQECDARAAQLAHELHLSERLRPVTVRTHAQLSPFVLYEPSRVSFEAIWEEGLPPNMEVLKVALSYTAEGLAVYDFSLGIRRTPWLPGTVRIPRNTRRANVATGPRGKIKSVSHQMTRYVDTHTQLRGEADLYVADVEESPANPGYTKMYLPPAHLNPGLPVTVKVPFNSTDEGAVYVEAYQRNGIVDTVDGLPGWPVYPGQTVMLQSDGEHDTTGHGANWHIVGGMSNRDVEFWIENNIFLPIPVTPPFNQLKVGRMEVQWWYIKANASGSCEISVLRNGSVISGSNPITLTSDDEAEGDVTGWDPVQLNNGDTLSFQVDSVSGITGVHISVGGVRHIPSPLG